MGIKQVKRLYYLKYLPNWSWYKLGVFSTHTKLVRSLRVKHLYYFKYLPNWYGYKAGIVSTQTKLVGSLLPVLASS